MGAIISGIVAVLQILGVVAVIGIDAKTLVWLIANNVHGDTLFGCGFFLFLMSVLALFAISGEVKIKVS